MPGKPDNPVPAPSTPSASQSPAKASFALILLLAVGSLFLSHTPMGALLLRPVDFLDTNLHELGHALFCVLTGGSVHGLTIVNDGDGHAGLTFGSGGIPFIYSQMGYLGTTLFGCLLLFFGRYRRNAKAVLMVLGALVGIGSLCFMVQTFGMANYGSAALMSIGLSLAMGGVLFFAGLKLNETVAHFLLLFLAVQISLNALNDVVWLIQISAGMAGAHSFSDATNMAQATGIPAVVWSIWWGVASLAMLYFTLRLAYRKSQ
ncbi:MAG: M50 family metallopeptidase [Cyanobacteria bacterium SZAS LIN-2]|nr:M50 family metallopeptidase [Cyanobacteria bacterium SZAS LIN-2]MBS2010683.1 M50 family metallopeptidase [Cyanobacteria bacterium SZAS TMP-1]